jgi:protein CpxP
MKNAKKLVLAAAALPMIFGTASAYAFGGKHGGQDGFDGKGFGGKCGGFDRGIMRDFDLTDEQKDQFKELRKDKRGERKGKRGKFNAEDLTEMQAYQTKAQELVLADTFDEGQAQELAAKMVEKQAERRVQMLQAQHEMLSILTPDQKAKLKELQAERMQECSERIQERMADRDS